MNHPRDLDACPRSASILPSGGRCADPCPETTLCFWSTATLASRDLSRADRRGAGVVLEFARIEPGAACRRCNDRAAAAGAPRSRSSILTKPGSTSWSPRSQPPAAMRSVLPAICARAPSLVTSSAARPTSLVGSTLFGTMSAIPAPRRGIDMASVGAKSRPSAQVGFAPLRTDSHRIFQRQRRRRRCRSQ